MLMVGLRRKLTAFGDADFMTTNPTSIDPRVGRVDARFQKDIDGLMLIRLATLLGLIDIHHGMSLLEVEKFFIVSSVEPSSPSPAHLNSEVIRIAPAREAKRGRHKIAIRFK